MPAPGSAESNSPCIARNNTTMLFYTNAADVLPPALLEEIRKHWIGLLYVAPPQDDTENRNQFILNELRSGRQPRDLAAVLGISLRRVYQIQKKNREKPMHS